MFYGILNERFNVYFLTVHKNVIPQGNINIP